LEKSEGWWTTIHQVDIDGDGDMDYLVGNAGLNSRIKASGDEPAEIFTYDFNNDGRLDPILCYYIQGKSYPMYTRDELIKQISTLGNKFPDYNSYADATINDIADAKLLEKSLKLSAHIMESCWIENVDGKLVIKKLPDLAQLSCINAFINYDFNGDGKQEILTAGNFYPITPQAGMSDASMGTLLGFSKDSITALHQVISPLWLNGDIRDMTLLSFKNGRKMVVVSKYNDNPGFYLIDPESLILH
jgi:hypothetical protein